MNEIGKKCFIELQRPKKDQNKAWKVGDSSFLLSKNRKKIQERIHYVQLKNNYSFSHKFSFSKIWTSLDFTESHKTS